MQNAKKCLIYLAIIGGLLLCLSPAIASGVISGNVTANGGAPLAGITIRTSGDPSYSTITASDGSYSLTIPAEPNGANYALLAVGTGLTPERMAFYLWNGQQKTVNFVMRPADTGQVVNLPAPLDWGEPSSAPTAPGDNYPVAFANTTALPVAGAPVISEWSETVKPDESFTMTGYQFTTRTGTDAGTDTIVWVWARTSSSGGVLKQATVWKVADNHIVATMPADIPFGMYLVWVENSNGASAPVCINRTSASWIGPMGSDTYAGGTRRIFGHNLSYNHGTTTNNVGVYIQSAPGGAFTPGGGAFTKCEVTKVNPYCVEFTVPADTPNGDYVAYIHNGQGGAYGWGDFVTFSVHTKFVRGATQILVNPSGTGADDAVAINNAINSVAALPNGGTVMLASGTYVIKSPITVKSNVALTGNGMNYTTLRWQAATANGGYALGMGDLSNAKMSDFTFTDAAAGLAGDFYSGGCSDCEMKNIRVNSEVNDRGRGMWPPDTSGGPPSGRSGIEISGCEFFREPCFFGYNWIHDNIFRGDYYWQTEAGCGFYCEKECFENNLSQTPNWPVWSDGDRYYLHFFNVNNAVWCKRVALCYGRSLYIANNTATDCAVEDNKGEMLLFHALQAMWWGQVLSNNGLTMTARTDGQVFDKAVTLCNYGAWTQGGGTVAPWWAWWLTGAQLHATIIGGKGMGQERLVNSGSNTSNTISVQKPWRVAPDSTSVIVFGGLWNNNIIYNNELDAFPPGYVQDYTASTGVQFDGNSWKNFVEGNVSKRTEVGRVIFTYSCGPVSWTEERNETAIDCHTRGFFVNEGEYNPYGSTAIGNAIRGFTGNTYAVQAYGNTSGATILQGLGTICENTNFSGPTGHNLGGSYAVGTSSDGLFSWPDGLVLYRNGNISVTDSPNIPVNVAVNDGKQLLINNTYSGNTPYWGLATYAQPVPMLRVAKFTGYAGYSIGSVLIPVVNAGTAGMTWTATPSDSWITAAIQSNGTLNPEATMGRLAVSVDTTGMTVGTHWGSVTVSGGGLSVKVGVRVDILEGTPPNLAPNAVFIPSPVVGTAPRSVVFDATTSNDPDGSIASYYWDFGDGSYGSGMTTTHTYTGQGTFTPVLTVTDNSGLTDQAWSNVSVSPSLTSVTLAGSPSGPVDPATPVTLTAAANGGYQTSYRFLINNGGGWTVLRDYDPNGTCTRTPSAAGYYEIKVEAKSLDSSNAFDVVSNVLSYPVGQVPLSGIKLWLKADTGVTADSLGNVSAWADQSGNGNNVQGTGSYQPKFATNVVNGRPVVRFAGGSQRLQTTSLVLSGNTSFTTFAVVKPDSLPPSTNQYIWWNGDATVTSGYGSGISTQSKIWCGWAGQNKALYDTSAAVIGNWYRVTSRYGSSNHEMWLNGVSKSSIGKTGSNFASGYFTIGNNGPSPTQGLYGDIAEVLIYNRNLTDAEKSSVENYLLARWYPPTTVSIDRIKDVKCLADGVLVSLTSAKVATVASGVYSDGSIYISESDRTCGMKVMGAGTVNVGDGLTLTGTTDTEASGERVLRVTSVSTGANTPLGAIGMGNNAFTASGQYVRVWGVVTGVSATYFTIDDGSKSPVNVEIDGLVNPLVTTPNLGSYVAVSGPAGYMAGGATCVRPRANSDIQVY